MPYCDAIVHETLRNFMMFTCGIAHRALCDTQLCGFNIPKDTMVIGMFNGMLSDERMFKSPNHFDPENFLNGEGKLSVPENFYPFALGRHRCLGEALARSNIFLLLTNVMQNFSLDVPAGHKIPSDSYVDGATPDVRDYVALVTPRI